MKLSEIAARLGLPVEGDGSVEIRRVAGLDEAGPGDLTFLGSPKYAAKAAATKAVAIILGPGATAAIPVVRAPDAYLAFARAVEIVHPRPRPAPGIHTTAVVAASARIAPGAYIGPYVVIEDDVVIGKNAQIHAHVVIHRGVRIGDDVVLHARVSVREGCVLGHRVVLQDGAVIGADGFGFTKRPDGTHEKVPQVGIVVLEDDVEIQANACVDRATLGETRIGRGTKIDNLVQIGHNCVVGENTILCSQVGLSGSTVVGKGVTLAGQVGVAGHLSIGDNVTAIGKTGISASLEPDQVVSGTPAIDARTWMKYSVIFPRLPDLVREVRDLGRRLDTLERGDRPA